MPVRVGVIGVGIMGAEHARLLSTAVSGSKVESVFDIDEERAASVAATCDARVIVDPIALIKEEAVDCVLIASSDATHEQFVLAALSAGKPVLCEKPLAPTTEACLRVLEAEMADGRQLVSVGFMRRFDAGYHDVKAGLASGEIGNALMLHCVHRNQAGGSPPSSVLITGSMVHELDLARWLLDDEIADITIHRPRRTVTAGSTQDPMFGVLRMCSGTLVDIEVFVNAGYGYEVRCEMVGERGTMLLDSPAPVAHRSPARGIGRVVGEDWRARFADSYRAELQAWVNAVAAASDPTLASAWDGYVATVAAEAGVRALESGGTEPVTLIDKPKLYR